MKRAAIVPASRQRRSRLAQMATSKRLVRGTISVRNVTCGKPGCCCAQGETHLAVYLVQSRQGKLRQLYIPKHLEERVRQAVADYQQLQRLLEELSEEEWKLLQERKE
ncbi:MAG: DUF6788 family protein [Acidobacteriota bacterium]